MNVARFEGGPKHGEMAGITIWPPPGEVFATDVGSYVLLGQSKMSDEMADHPHLLRGCTYRWTPAQFDGRRRRERR